MVRGFLRAAAAVAFGAVLLWGCATTKPIAEWQDESYTGPVDDILIIGVSEQEGTRRLFEDTFVRELKNRNVTAVSSATIMPADEKISRETVEAAIKGREIDAVLVTRLVGEEEKEQYVPSVYSPRPYYGSYYGYYSRARDYAYQPGYYAKYTVLKLETNLYDAKSGRLVWSMQTETIDPKGPAELIQEKIKIVIEKLRQRKLI